MVRKQQGRSFLLTRKYMFFCISPSVMQCEERNKCPATSYKRSSYVFMHGEEFHKCSSQIQGGDSCLNILSIIMNAAGVMVSGCLLFVAYRLIRSIEL